MDSFGVDEVLGAGAGAGAVRVVVDRVVVVRVVVDRVVLDEDEEDRAGAATGTGQSRSPVIRIVRKRSLVGSRSSRLTPSTSSKYRVTDPREPLPQIPSMPER